MQVPPSALPLGRALQQAISAGALVVCGQAHGCSIGWQLRQSKCCITYGYNFHLPCTGQRDRPGSGGYHDGCACEAAPDFADALAHRVANVTAEAQRRRVYDR